MRLERLRDAGVEAFDDAKEQEAQRERACVAHVLVRVREILVRVVEETFVSASATI
jgi:hypothetical protein